MKKYMLLEISKNILRNSRKILVLLFCPIVLTTCDYDVEEPPLDEKDQLIMEYIEYYPEFSEFKKAVLMSGLGDVLRIRREYTLFLPDNDAMYAFYAKNNYSSIEGINLDYLKSLVLNHLFEFEIVSSDIHLGCLPKRNAIDDYVASGFDDQDIVINKYARIVDRDIDVANGIIHRVDSVIEIEENNVATWLADNPKYTIFSEALEKTGIADTLKLIEIQYGNIQTRVRFTILPVSDSVFNKYNISSFNDLVNKYGADQDFTNSENKLYKFIDYHCLEGTFYFTNIYDDGFYYTISRDNRVYIEVTDDYKINYDTSTAQYTGFITNDANFPAKNGVIHGINDLLEPPENKPYDIIFETTNYIDVKSEDCYIDGYTNEFYDPDYFHKIKWGDGDFIRYFWGPNFYFINNDCISMSETDWWLEFTLPNISKGKYTFIIAGLTGPNRANCEIYIDDVKLQNNMSWNDSILGTNYDFKEIEVAEVNWKTTGEHTMLFKTIDPGTIYWDYFRFKPVN